MDKGEKKENQKEKKKENQEKGKMRHMAWEESGGGKFSPLLDQFGEEESERGEIK